MQRFPLKAKIYIWLVVALGAAAFAGAYLHLGFRRHEFPPLLALWAFSGVATFWKVRLFVGPRSSENVSNMSLGTIPIFFTLLCFGPLAGMIAWSVGCIASSLYPRRNYYFQVLFNLASVSLAVLAAGLILRQVGLAPDVAPPGSPAMAPAGHHWQALPAQLPAIFLSILVYFLINTGSIATAIALTSNARPLQVWRSHFFWTAPNYFAGASGATILFALGLGDALRHSARWGATAAIIALVAAPILVLTYLSFKTHMEKVHANEEHILELEKGKEELQQLYMSTVESLALAIDAKDRYTREHILRVQDVAVSIAKEMGVHGDELLGINTGALLHDIGKLGIPEHILGKPGKLTDEEFEKIKTHPAIGSKILQPVRFPWPVMGAVRSHHERWDGTGYPDGLKGEEIPLAGRILAVADVYDALTSDRSYRKGWEHGRACEYIRESAGSHFDPQVVAAFLQVVERNPLRWSGNLLGHKVASSAVVDAHTLDEVADGINRTSFEYSSLYEISQTVSVTLELPETLSLLANKINKIFNASSCVILLADDEEAYGGSGGAAAAASRRLRAEMAVGVNEPFFSGATARVGAGVTGGVAAGGDAVIGDYQQDDLLLASAAAPWAPLGAALIAPLVADSVVVGTVNLYHEKAGAFRPDDLRFLLAVSAQAGRAIRNARVFEMTRESALTDALTGLHNARYLSLFLEQELHRAAREERTLAVLVMDMDNFKPVNDTFGHARGNEVLRDLGGLFRSTLRSGDLVARYAGDEFVVVLPGATAAEAQVVSDKIRKAVDAYDPGAAGGKDLGGIRVGVSIGVACYPNDGTDAATLIACADGAMYRNKSDRRGRHAALAVGEGEKAAAHGLRLVA